MYAGLCSTRPTQNRPTVLSRVMPTATISTTGRSRDRLIRTRGTATSSSVASTALTSTLSSALTVVSANEPVLRSRNRSSVSSASTAATERPSSTKTTTSTPRSTRRRTTRLPGCWLRPWISRCEERIASTHPMPVNTRISRPTTPAVPLLSATWAGSRNGRFSPRNSSAAALTSSLSSRIAPKIAYATRASAKTAKKP